MEKLRLSDLSQPSVDHIGSNTVLGPQAGYQKVLFTLPPNPDTIDQAEEDLRNADGRNPWVAQHRTPATPRNLNDDFVLECDGQNVFATPSANLAAAFKVQRLRKDYSALRAQSSSSRHSTAHHHDRNEVNQPDLRSNLRNRDVRPVINDRHCERDEAELERRRQYDEEYGPPGANQGGRARHGDANQHPHRPPQGIWSASPPSPTDSAGSRGHPRSSNSASTSSTVTPTPRRG
ncbi:hypothetical protein C2845_PM05G21140 [Panicum miliaceum]|uniref:Uncharacterized protein n=1 Tax=Panicum miliaceum TaxID=4540 RepID=A0A3L6T567_PANMI|nr:hypothetical protein C2845_PM05G21140 [Panicum miliaceum]